MTVRPELSVVLPYRDAEETLEEAVASVLEERDVALELIAVDDGSTDRGPELLASIAARDPRVRVVRTEPRGLVPALDLGLELARAPFVARMDADDVSLRGRFSRQLELLQRDPRIAVVGCLVEAFPEGAVEGGLLRYVEWQNALLTPEDHARERFVESPLCHPSVTMRLEAVREVGGYREGPFPEDYDLFLRLASRGYALAKVPFLGLRWRHSEGRVTFRDPRCSPEAIRRCKAPFLAEVIHRDPREFVLWGAGREGRRLARELEAFGAIPARFVDIDPKKIGRTARGRPIGSAEGLRPDRAFVIAAVASRGARAEIREGLRARGFSEGEDFIFAA